MSARAECIHGHAICCFVSEFGSVARQLLCVLGKEIFSNCSSLSVSSFQRSLLLSLPGDSQRVGHVVQALVHLHPKLLVPWLSKRVRHFNCLNGFPPFSSVGPSSSPLAPVSAT